VLEAETHSTNENDPSSSTGSEVHHHKEQIVIDNPNDPVSDVTHRVEDVHITVKDETQGN